MRCILVSPEGEELGSWVVLSVARDEKKNEEKAAFVLLPPSVLTRFLRMPALFLRSVCSGAYVLRKLHFCNSERFITQYRCMLGLATPLSKAHYSVDNRSEWSHYSSQYGICELCRGLTPQSLPPPHPTPTVPPLLYLAIDCFIFGCPCSLKKHCLPRLY